jgi:hypothetical protein
MWSNLRQKGERPSTRNSRAKSAGREKNKGLIASYEYDS